MSSTFQKLQDSTIFLPMLRPMAPRNGPEVSCKHNPDRLDFRRGCYLPSHACGSGGENAAHYRAPLRPRTAFELNAAGTDSTQNSFLTTMLV